MTTPPTGFLRFKNPFLKIFGKSIIFLIFWMFLHHPSKFGEFSLKIGGEIICQSWPLLTPFFNFRIVHWYKSWWCRNRLQTATVGSSPGLDNLMRRIRLSLKLASITHVEFSISNAIRLSLKLASITQIKSSISMQTDPT